VTTQVRQNLKKRKFSSCSTKEDPRTGISSSYSSNVTPRCYCSSYSTSTVASTVLMQWLLRYKPNSMKMVFSTNGVGSFLCQFEILNLQTPVHYGPLSSVWNFSELFEAELGHTPKR
jgi:hypothetical protein